MNDRQQKGRYRMKGNKQVKKRYRRKRKKKLKKDKAN
jgi:hypothetical protein